MRSLPPEDLIISVMYRCNECGVGTERFLYHAGNDDYRYFDPDTEDRDTGIERFEEENAPVECRNCGSTDTFPEK